MATSGALSPRWKRAKVKAGKELEDFAKPDTPISFSRWVVHEL